MIENEDKGSWMTSKNMLEFFIHTRECNVTVEIDGILVPITALHYDSTSDNYVITLFKGEDYRMALTTDGLPDNADNGGL